MKNKSTLAILGADDPEMQAIEAVCHEAGVPVAYAVSASGARVTSGSAYSAFSIVPAEAGLLLSKLHRYGGCVYVVECGFSQGADHALAALGLDGHTTDTSAIVIRVDHHRPGDPGYDAPPSDFWLGSSLGQMFSHLSLGPSRRPTKEEKMIAAGDHCLAAAYRGLCPGVAPVRLFDFRLKQKATFWGCPVEQLQKEAEEARALLLASRDARPWLDKAAVVDMWMDSQGCCGSVELWRGNPADYSGPVGGAYDAGDRTGSVRWCRPDGSPCGPADFLHRVCGDSPRMVPEMACYCGMPTLVVRGGKANLLAAPPELVKKFLAGGIVPVKNCYGSPARGFAGAALV